MTNKAIFHKMEQILNEIENLRSDIAELKKMQINANSCFNGNNNVGNIEDSVVQIIQGNDNIAINDMKNSNINLSLTDNQFSLLLNSLLSLPLSKKDFLIEKFELRGFVGKTTEGTGCEF